MSVAPLMLGNMMGHGIKGIVLPKRKDMLRNALGKNLLSQIRPWVELIIESNRKDYPMFNLIQDCIEQGIKNDA